MTKNNETVAAKIPLITFALLSYNQEKYIREAVEGAFSQSYSNLEIILSDDYSTDNTFEIIQEIVKNYIGPHKIKINKNSDNFGITGHINKIGQISNGQYIVFAAGDDFSLPERTSELLNLCIKNNALIAFSGFNLMDENSLKINTENNSEINKIYENKNIKDGFFLGPSYIIKNDLFYKFPKINEGVHHEDVLFPIRAKFLGGKIVYTGKKLINYRTSSGVTKKLQDEIKINKINALKIINIRSFSMAHQITVDANKIGIPIGKILKSRFSNLLIEKYLIEKNFYRYFFENFFSIKLWKYKLYLIKKYT